jgi:hypothetical protein
MSLTELAAVAISVFWTDQIPHHHAGQVVHHAQESSPRKRGPCSAWLKWVPASTVMTVRGCRVPVVDGILGE